MLLETIEENPDLSSALQIRFMQVQHNIGTITHHHL